MRAHQRSVSLEKPIPRARLVLVLLLAAAAPAAAQSPAPAEAEAVFPLRGGAAALARTLGIGDRIPPSRVMLTAIRILWEAPDGVVPATDRRRRQVAEYLQRAEAGPQGSQATDTLPAFLPTSAWSVIFQQAGVRHASLARAILEKRAVALAYYGAASLDSPTRAYLAAHPSLLRWLSNEGNAALFAAFARALHVRDNVVVVPGGPDAVPLWAAVGDHDPATNAEAFFRKVLANGSGKLALLYDGVVHLDEGARRFALGLQLPADQRVAAFRALYDASGAALAQWRPDLRPFERVPYDVVHLLLATDVGPQGELRGPSWVRFWKTVFDASFDPLKQQLSARDLEAGGRFDAASLVEMIVRASEPERRERAETWLFADRTFRGIDASAALDVVVALKGYARYPTLLLTLERMGITSPATYAAAVRAADQLPNADRRLWQFQAALAIVERARSARSFEPAVAERLVRSLCRTVVAEGDDSGRLVRWLGREVLDAAPDSVLPAAVPAAERPLETRLLAIMAGSVASPSNRALLAHPAVEWEGLKYRVDPAGATLARLVAVRAKQGGAALDDVLGLSRVADAIAAATSVQDVQAAVQQLHDVAAPLLALRADSRPTPFGETAPRLDRLVEGASAWARKLKAVPDASRRERISRPLQEAADHHLAVVLGSIAYAPHAGQPAGTLLLTGDPSRVHDFRFFKPGMELGRRTAWELPVEWRDSELGSRISGSLLGLETVLGRHVLTRMAGETMPEAPSLSDAVRQAFTETACLASPFDLTDASRDALLAAVERGRRRVSTLTARAGDVDQVASELDEWRAQELRWMLDHQVEGRLQVFSLGELARLGGVERPGVEGFDAWGTSGISLDRGFRTVYPARLPWSTLLGRRGVRAVPALVPDLAIGLAATSARLHLPAVLTAGLLAVATQEFLDTLRMPYDDDWQAMVANAQSAAGSRVEDLVAALTDGGPLVPDER